MYLLACQTLKCAIKDSFLYIMLSRVHKLVLSLKASFKVLTLKC